MTIGIDIRMLTRGTKTGIEEYTVNLLSNMLCLDKNVKYRLFYNGYRKTELNYDWLKLPNVELAQFKIPNRVLDISSRVLNYPKIDELLKGVEVFFSPHIFLSSVSQKCKTVTTFHDLSFEKYPEFYSRGKNYWHFSMSPKKQARQADRIIAVSKSTKDDLVSSYDADPDKIEVIYSGVDNELGIENNELGILEVKKKYKLPEKYILYLGTLEPRKNIIGLIKAFELFKKSYKLQAADYKLIIAGSKGWLYKDIFKTVNNSLAKNDIIFTGFIKDEDKSALYGNAELFVYPSFYEGFGFPPLEAMTYGTPVITSNFSSLPEAVGDAAIMINPYNLDELAEAMRMVLADDKLKEILIQKGFERVKKFNWQKCAEETLEVLKAV
ncbi:MAG: glycosyltransferase family 1 protein [Patescibacteria group bacterium]|nr:glycosyltransferase family 1 protein [Patescibacteria group bacterium]